MEEAQSNRLFIQDESDATITDEAGSYLNDKQRHEFNLTEYERQVQLANGMIGGSPSHGQDVTSMPPNDVALSQEYAPFMHQSHGTQPAHGLKRLVESGNVDGTKSGRHATEGLNTWTQS